MYLSKLEIIGFKSFPHKTALRFNEGMTTIVGPNGCGKSNIIDAIRWAIGEQKASTLRSDKMENVIFNGAGSRRPLGMAEVSLTIENTKGVLPTEYSEVTITRRLFRNGDSEYLLNKTLCRLKDIVDLFMDTGMGANAYSVIELKMIETILSDRADERRRMFEEAAGVTKYKARRKEALRKLDTTQQDLTRVSDILKEVSKKVGTLERQAKKAEEFKKLDTERLELEIDILEREYAATLARIAPLEKSLEEVRSRKDELDTHLAQEEMALRGLEQEQAEIEMALSEANKDLSAIASRIAQVEQQHAVAEEKKRSLHGVIERAIRDSEEAQGGIEALVADRKDMEVTLAELAEQIAVAEREHEAIKVEVAEAETELNNLRRSAKGSQEEVIGIINRIAELRGEEERISTRIETIHQRLERFDAEDAEASQNMAHAAEVITEQERKANEADAHLLSKQQQFEQAQQHKAALRAEIDERRNGTIEFHNAINSRQSKIEFLTGLVDQDESVRFLVSEKDWSTVDRLTVAETLSTKEEYRLALAAALASAAHYMVVQTIDDAKRGMQSLEANRKGKVTFVCLDRVPKTEDPKPLNDPRVIGWASGLSSSVPEHSQLRRFLLNETVIVRSIDEAMAVTIEGLAEQAATLGGVLVRAGGVVRGGSTTRDEGSTIGKREQIEKLSNEIIELQAKLDELNGAISAKSEEYNSINLGEFSDLIRVAQQELGNLEKRRAQAEYEKEHAEDVVEGHNQERLQLHEELQKLHGAQESIHPRREALASERHAAEESARALAQELEEFEARFSGLLETMNEKRIDLVGLQGDERGAKTELLRIERDREQAERIIEQRKQEKEQSEEELEELVRFINEKSGQLEMFRVELAQAKEKRDLIAEAQTTKRAEIATHAETLREERKGYEQSLEHAHSLEMKIGELRSRVETQRERAKEELEIELQVKDFSDDQDSMTDLRERLRDAKGKIKMLGTVNLLAYEEWLEESERHKFLQAQVEDLRNAEKSLLDTITEINNTAQRKFVETFEQIRENFKNLFRTLFAEGDEADLAIEEHDDPLEAKIEIVAKPRGKRPHSIDLLSGGEKTLTAIALLFAIYLVKPSPFCILDEVDAPLDDANIDRFVRLIRQFAQNTQFIIVTHNKRTMSAADTMYGVTQEEDGISKIVSVRFAEMGQRDSAAVAA